MRAYAYQDIVNKSDWTDGAFCERYQLHVENCSASTRITNVKKYHVNVRVYRRKHGCELV